MSDYHILSCDKYGNTFNVVFHVPVPNSDNKVGTNYRTAIVEMLGGADNITSAAPFIQSAELTQLKTGELYEVTETFHSHPGQTTAQKRASLDARYSAVVSEITTDLGRQLSYWGYSRDVP